MLESLRGNFIKSGIKIDDNSGDNLDVSQISTEDIELLKPGSELMENLKNESTTAFALSLLLRLKQFLKQQYCLSDEKCQTFSPMESTKVGLSILKQLSLVNH